MSTYRVEIHVRPRNLAGVPMGVARWEFARAGLSLAHAKDLCAFLVATDRAFDARLIPEQPGQCHCGKPIACNHEAHS